MSDQDEPPWLYTELHPSMYQRWGLSFQWISSRTIKKSTRNHNLVCWFLEKHPGVREGYSLKQAGYFYYDILAAAELEVLGESDYSIQSHLQELIDANRNDL